MTKLVFPWPHRDLSQNARIPWRKRHKATKAARHVARWMAIAAGVQHNPTSRIVWTFYPPDRRRRDCANMPAMCKAWIDGIADAMGCDDNGFRCAWPEEFGEVRKDGQVVVEIEEDGE